MYSMKVVWLSGIIIILRSCELFFKDLFVE